MALNGKRCQKGAKSIRELRGELREVQRAITGLADCRQMLSRAVAFE